MSAFGLVFPVSARPTPSLRNGVGLRRIFTCPNKNFLLLAGLMDESFLHFQQGLL